MRLPPIHLGILVLAIAATFAFVTPAPAQQGAPPDPVVAYDAAIAAHRAGDWDRGLRICDIIIKAYRSPLKEFGPVFGHFYYLKGLMHFGKKEYGPAIEAFKTCYEKFPNPKTKQKAGEDPLLPNRFRIHALTQWAGVLMVQGKFTEASVLYEKALAEADGEGSLVNKINIAINVGQCYLRAEQYAKGKEQLTKALEAEFLAAYLREHVFMILAEDWSPHVSFNAVQAFLAEWGSVLEESSLYSRYQKNPRIRFLAQRALQSGEPLRTLLWHRYIHNPRHIIGALENRLADLEADEENADVLAAEKENTDAQIADQITGHADDLLRGATCHYQIGNFAGSYAGFKALADTMPDNESRPVILHNLVSSAVQLGLWKEGYTYGKFFLKEFPRHELKPSVARLLVEVVFLEGEYDEAYAIATDVRRDMTAGSPMRDIPDFIVGASLHHLGRHTEADTELTAYLENYRDGMRLEPARFYFGSNKVKLFEWETAAPALEQFMELHPNSELLPSALYQAGLANFMLGDLDKSYTQAGKLQARYPDVPEIPSSYNLVGDILGARGDAPVAERSASYQEGKRTAEAAGDQPETAAYALWQLAILAHGAENWEKVGALYDEYLRDHPDSVFRLDITATAVEGLYHLGRGEEALATLREHVTEFADQPQSAELSEMFGTYLSYLKEHFTPEETLERLANFPGPTPRPPALQGWLDIASVELLEAKADDDAALEAINKILYALQSGFVPEQHANYVIVKLARWASEFRNQSAAAQELYEFIIANRPGTPGYEFALLDTALLQATSGSPEEKLKARAKFSSVLEEFQNPELREAATLGIARIFMEEENYIEARSWWEKYLEDRTWSQARAEANFQLASCIENLGKKPEALKLFVSVYANFPGHLDWSTGAYLRTAHILKDDGEELKALLVSSPFHSIPFDDSIR